MAPQKQSAKKRHDLEKRLQFPDKTSDNEQTQQTDYIENLLKEYVGVHIQELNHDITQKLHENPIIDYSINDLTDLKTAKRLFKIRYIKKMLRLHYGNVSEVAEKLNVNRKTIHRLVSELDIQEIRDQMRRPYEIKREAFSSALHDALDNYKEILHPNKLQSLYGKLPELTQELTDELPLHTTSLAQAEQTFEKKYIIASLEHNEYDLKKTAQELDIRYETLLRKIKRYTIHI